jgi:hypothetical protein
VKKWFRAAPLILSFAGAPSIHSWQISGKVTDRTGVPVAQAQVCVQGGTSECTASSAQGEFSLTSSTAVRPGASVLRGIALEIRGGAIILEAARAADVLLEWFSARGARLAAYPALHLEAGPNRLDASVPDGAPVRFLRLTQGNLQVTWKVVLGGVGEGSFLSASPDPLFKTAEISTPAVTATKAGYKARTYYAQNSSQDPNAWIILAADGDDTTYALPGTSYPATRMPPNQMTGSCKVTACKFCYGGAQANNILGHSATGKGTWTFNQLYAPADGDYEITWYFYCGMNDNNGDKDCGGIDSMKTAAGCRPGILIVNGQELPTVYQWRCFSTPWTVVHERTFSLPLKAGNDNSIKIYSKTADVINIDRILIKDGR